MSNIIKKISKKISLETRILTLLQTMPIFWKKNKKGEYCFILTKKQLDEETKNILKVTLQWIDDGMPKIEKTKEFIEKKKL